MRLSCYSYRIDLSVKFEIHYEKFPGGSPRHSEYLAGNISRYKEVTIFHTGRMSCTISEFAMMSRLLQKNWRK